MIKAPLQNSDVNSAPWREWFKSLGTQVSEASQNKVINTDDYDIVYCKNGSMVVAEIAIKIANKVITLPYSTIITIIGQVYNPTGPTYSNITIPAGSKSFTSTVTGTLSVTYLSE